MTEFTTVYFRSRDGVHEVKLPPIEAANASRRHPHEWSLKADKFADAPEGFVATQGNGGGIGRVRGASVRAD
jgi:hypothetical protein